MSREPLLSNADGGTSRVPPAGVVYVAPCEGCGGLPHGGTTDEANCLRRALRLSRAEVGRLVALLDRAGLPWAP